MPGLIAWQETEVSAGVLLGYFSTRNRLPGLVVSLEYLLGHQSTFTSSSAFFHHFFFFRTSWQNGVQELRGEGGFEGSDPSPIISSPLQPLGITQIVQPTKNQKTPTLPQSSAAGPGQFSGLRIS